MRITVSLIAAHLVTPLLMHSGTIAVLTFGLAFTVTAAQSPGSY